MKAPILALILLSLLGLSSCCTPQIKYVDRVVYEKPIIPHLDKTELPTVKLNVWGDYATYKAQCETQIKSCNVDKQTLENSAKGLNK